MRREQIIRNIKTNAYIPYSIAQYLPQTFMPGTALFSIKEFTKTKEGNACPPGKDMMSLIFLKCMTVKVY